MRMRRPGSVALGAAVVAVLAGCGITIPADPEGTLDDVTGGVLEVGITHNPPHTDTTGTHPTGTETELVASFAETIDARVQWRRGSEQELVQLLEIGELDLVVGGFSEQTPWSEHVALTRPYGQAVLADGSTSGLVMLAPMGENAFLSALERHLDAAMAPEGQS